MAEPQRIRRLITAVFDRRAAQQVEGEMVRSLESAGQRGGDTFLRELRGRFASRMAGLREELARGIIDKEEFRRRSDEAAKAFNEGLLSSIQKARAEGKLTDQEYIKLTRNLKQTGHELKRTGDVGVSAWDRIRGKIIAAGAAMAAFFALRQMRAFAASMFEIGTTAEETASKFETTFGTASEKVQRFVDDFGTLAGLNKTVGREMTATAGAIVQGMGASQDASADFSEGMVRLAADLQSFHNVPIGETFAAIKSGLTGQFTPMDRFGIVVRQADVNLRALRDTGKTQESQLTQLEKAQAALNLMMERAGPAMGDLERTQDSTANTTRRLKTELDNLRIDLATALLPAFSELVRKISDNRAGLIDLAQRGIRFVSTLTTVLVRNFDELVAIVVSLTKAILVVGALTAVVRLGGAMRAADLATKGWITTMRAALPLMGARGLFILGVIAIEEAFRRVGKSARDAAREARQAAADFKDALRIMDESQLTAQRELLTLQIDVLNEDLARLLDTPESRNANVKRIREISAQLVVFQERLKLTERTIQTNTAATEQLAVTTETVAEATESVADALAEEIKLLEAGHRFGVLTNAERARGIELLTQTRDALRQANIPLEERIELTQRLRTLEGMGFGSVTPQTAGTAPRPGAMVLNPVPVPDRARVSEWQNVLNELADSSYATAYHMQSAFSEFFSSLAVGFSDSRAGFHSLADAAQGVGGSIVAGLSQGMAQYHMAQAVGKLAQGIWPPNPAALLSAAKHTAAAGLFGALTGLSGAGRRSAGSPPSEIGRNAVDRAERASADIHISVDGIDPLNPRHQDLVHYTARSAGERYGGAVYVNGRRR